VSTYLMPIALDSRGLHEREIDHTVTGSRSILPAVSRPWFSRRKR
jgi:hypothetical protein